MTVTRRMLVAVAWALAVVVPTACDDDNDRYGDLASAATELARAIGGSDVTVVASPSSCVVPDSCPDSARVDLPDPTELSPDEIAAIATDLGWDATVVDERLIILANDDDMSGSIDVDGQGRVALVVGED